MTQSPRVLVVDDEPIVGKRLLPVLTRVGCEVEVFSAPQEALARLAQQAFDIVITDVKMGEIDGIEVLEQALLLNPTTKVILITGYAMMELARRAMELGAFDFVSKPFTPTEVRAVVSRAAAELGLSISEPNGTTPE